MSALRILILSLGREGGREGDAVIILSPRNHITCASLMSSLNLPPANTVSAYLLETRHPGAYFLAAVVGHEGVAMNVADTPTLLALECCGVQ